MEGGQVKPAQPQDEGRHRRSCRPPIADSGAKSLWFGYGLPLPVARHWGLYISAGRGKTSIGIEEPALFSEPGVFLVRADGTLYYGSVQTMPFARPHFSELLKAIDVATASNYPARGEVQALARALAWGFGFVVEGRDIRQGAKRGCRFRRSSSPRRIVWCGANAVGGSW